VSVSRAGELKVYRPPFLVRALSWALSAAFFFIGLSMVSIGLSQRDWGAVAIGVLVVLFSLWLGARLATTRLIVTAAGLVYIKYLRRGVVSWAEVQAFGVGASRSVMRWPTLVIHRTDGSLLATNLDSFTRTYPAHIADELTAWQRQLPPTALGQLP
jgi:hypothetical protein